MSKNKYKINSHNQLIDLNGDSINFELSFDIQSVNNNEQFEILVVDQNTLDNNENFTKTEELPLFLVSFLVSLSPILEIPAIMLTGLDPENELFD